MYYVNAHFQSKHKFGRLVYSVLNIYHGSKYTDWRVLKKRNNTFCGLLSYCQKFGISVRAAAILLVYHDPATW